MAFTAAVLQYCARSEPRDTITAIAPLIAEAAKNGAHLICLPECASFIAPNRDALRTIAEPEDSSPSLEALRAIAADHKIMLHIGSLLMRQQQGKLCVNRGFVIASDGAILAQYDKIHMFDADVGDGRRYRESEHFQAGHKLVHLETDIGHLGLSICYDMRFPHLYRQLAQKGAQILLAPSAFTAVTGAAHWHILLRARAIETGCFVLAAAQYGTHADGRKTYGHALIVSPWGEILADAKKQEAGFVTAPIDLAQVDKARTAVPSITHQPDFT